MVGEGQSDEKCKRNSYLLPLADICCSVLFTVSKVKSTELSSLVLFTLRLRLGIVCVVVVEICRFLYICRGFTANKAVSAAESCLRKSRGKDLKAGVQREHVRDGTYVRSAETVHENNSFETKQWFLKPAMGMFVCSNMQNITKRLSLFQMAWNTSLQTQKLIFNSTKTRKDRFCLTCLGQFDHFSFLKASLQKSSDEFLILIMSLHDSYVKKQPSLFQKAQR